MVFQKADYSWGSRQTTTLLSLDQREYTGQGAELTELVQSMYSIVLYDTVRDEVLEVSLDPAKRTNLAEYFFRVPPKTHELSEPFMTTIQPTQNGGKYVESYGSILKAVRLTGTTGLRPNKIASPRIPLLDISDEQIQTLLGANIANFNKPRGIPEGEATGHDDIIFLRNIFRHYSDLKESDELARRVVMLWRNIKDDDYWIVEPEEFKLQQSSVSPLTYEYHITLRTLSRFEFSYLMRPDPLKEARDIRRMLARIQEYSQNLLNIYMTVANQINKVTGLINFGSNLILSPILNTINGLNAIKTSAFGVVRGLRTQALNLQESLEEAIERLLDVPDNVFEEATSLYNDPTRAELVRTLRRGILICAHILCEPCASESSVGADAASAIDRQGDVYNRPGTVTTPSRAPNSTTYIGSDRMGEAVGADVVRPGEDIRDIAYRVLGDRSKWRLLVVLNKLRAPFVSVHGGPGVLAPGDSVLYPVSAASGGVVGTQHPSNEETTDANSPVYQSYGRDLRLKSEAVGSAELTDLVVNQRGDLGSIQGISNVEQAVKLKFMTERGELPAHPTYGAKFAIGTKSTPRSFNELRINTMNTLAMDSRIERIESLQFVALGDNIAVVPKVKLVNTRDVLDVSFALRRF